MKTEKKGDLISRGQVMSDYLSNLGKKDSYKAKYEALVKAVDDAPAVDAVPVVHGRWISDYEDVLFSCSVCGTQISTSWDYEDLEWGFCPTCGAKMDGDGHE